MFTDVPAGQWYTNTVKLGKYLGIAWGYPGNVFKPDQPATRAESLSFTMRALGIGVLFAAGAAGLAYVLAVRKAREV